MSKLVLCEKPSQARDIAKVLGATQSLDGYIEGNGYHVTWCLGHLLELAPPESYRDDLKPWRIEVLPVKPDVWQLLPKPSTSKQLNVIKKLLKEVKHVIIATDADREGDVIGREVLQYFNYKGIIERLWLSALDEQSIKKAFADLKPDSFSQNLYQAGLGRQRADWLVGMNMTMATTAQFSGGKGVLSVGRVQSPTLKLIVDRDHTVEQFASIDYYDVVIKLNHENAAFNAKWLVPEAIADEAGHCLNVNDAENIQRKVKDNHVIVTQYTAAEKTIKPPLGLSLSALQKLCSSQFGFSAKETLEVAQSLYETHKATTYPRTDCQYLPSSQLADAMNIFAILIKDPHYVDLIEQCDVSRVSPVWNDKKITAHHAIIPTLNANVDVEKMNSQERKLYDLICRYYIAQFLGDYRYFQKEVELICDQEKFKTHSHTPKELGWKRAIQAQKEEHDNDTDTVQAIPVLTVNTSVQCLDATIEAKKTKPPSRFTEGTLITAMKSIAKYLQDEASRKILKETAGIGTEATRANIIETLLSRGYIERKSKQLISTTKGRGLIALLPSLVTDPTMTANWEGQLDDVAQGKYALDDFLKAQSGGLVEMLGAIATHDKAIAKPEMSQHACPACQHPLIKRQGKFGIFWGCSYYPTCKENYKDNKGEPILNKSQYPCPECDKGMLRLRTGTKGAFWGCSNYPKCKVIKNDQRGKPENVETVK